MAYRTWEDFLEAKKMEDQPPKTAKELKCDGDTSKQIVQGQSAKPAQGKGANPYAAPNASKPKTIVRVAEKSGKGLADEKVPNMSYKDVIPHGEKPNQSNIKAESTANFILNRINENESKKKIEFDPTMTCQFTGRKVVPAFYEVAKWLAHALPQNEQASKTFLRELKGVDGGLSALLSEMFNHREVYSAMAESMGDPTSVAPRRFARAMNECYSNWMNELTGVQPEMPGVEAPMLPTGQPPMGPGMMGMGEAVDLPIDKRIGDDDSDYDYDSDPTGQSGGPPVPPDVAQGGMPPLGNDTNLPMGGGMGMGGMGGGMGGGPGMGGGMGGPPGMGGGPGMDGPIGDPNMMSQMGGDNGGPAPIAGSNQQMPGAMGMNPQSQPAGTVDTPSPMKPQREFAYHHLTREMSRYEPMKSVMREVLGG